MPKTASKRAEARRIAQVQRAHEVRPVVTAPAVNRKVPFAQARATRRTPTRMIRDYPWGTTIFVLLLIGLVILVMYNQHLGPWTQKAAPTQAVCNLTTHTCNKAPLMTINAKDYYSATIKTKYGDIVMSLDAVNAPIAVNNFVFLADQGFYNGLTFNRVEHIGDISPVTNQPSNLNIIQGGAGGAKDMGPGYTAKFESNLGTYAQGTVAVANSSQFFICVTDMSKTIGTQFDVLGHVTAGLDILGKIQVNDVMQSVTIGVTTVQPTPGPTGIPAATATATAKP
jgi:cyclophilin family peptidyl-prolyl cis-trans isomerase